MEIAMSLRVQKTSSVLKSRLKKKTVAWVKQINRVNHLSELYQQYINSENSAFINYAFIGSFYLQAEALPSSPGRGIAAERNYLQPNTQNEFAILLGVCLVGVVVSALTQQCWQQRLRNH